jgi:hypothetical protein
VSDAVMSLCRPSRIICSKTHRPTPTKRNNFLSYKMQDMMLFVRI